MKKTMSIKAVANLGGQTVEIITTLEDIDPKSNDVYAARTEATHEAVGAVLDLYNELKKRSASIKPTETKEATKPECKPGNMISPAQLKILSAIYPDSVENLKQLDSKTAFDMIAKLRNNQ